VSVDLPCFLYERPEVVRCSMRETSYTGGLQTVNTTLSAALLGCG
jgi:hypothetical protein